jgi:hypothetical protein
MANDPQTPWPRSDLREAAEQDDKQNPRWRRTTVAHLARSSRRGARSATIDLAGSHKLSHISLAIQAYRNGGQPSQVGTSPTDAVLATDYFDILIGGDPQYVRNVLGDPFARVFPYDNLFLLWWYLCLDWFAYADARGIDREAAFFHSANTPFAFSSSGFGDGQGIPAQSWWDAQISRGGILSNLYSGQIAGTAGTWLTSGAQNVQFSNDPGDYVLAGYWERFDTINVELARAASGFWEGVLEYPVAVDNNGVPPAAAWQPFRGVTDGSNALTQNGTIHFSPHQDPPWVKSVAAPGGAGMLAQPGYYVRYRTTNGLFSTAPIVSFFGPPDYTGQANEDAGNIPLFDSSLDDGTGYIPDATYAAGDGVVPAARFKYQSRMPSSYGMMSFAANVRNEDFCNFTFERVTAALDPQADGIFADNSGVSNFYDSGQTVENPVDVDLPAGALVARINAALGIGPRGPRIVLPNLGTVPRVNMVSQEAAAFEEQSLLDSFTWLDYETYATNFVATAGYNQNVFQVVDSFATTDSTDPRVQLLLLAGFYTLNVSPDLTAFTPSGDSGPTPGSNAPDESPFYPYRFWNALLFDVGAPTSGVSYTTGTDPQSNLPFRVYRREYEKAVVLYKPLSTLDGSAAGTAGAGAVTYELGADYWPVGADGTLGAMTQSINLPNASGAILARVGS